LILDFDFALLFDLLDDLLFDEDDDFFSCGLYPVSTSTSP